MSDSQTPSPWAVDSIEKAKASGIMVGDNKGWNPKQPVTREMLAVILDRLGLLDRPDPALIKKLQKLKDINW